MFLARNDYVVICPDVALMQQLTNLKNFKHVKYSCVSEDHTNE